MRHNDGMAKLGKTTGPAALALAAFKLWQRLPAKQRRWALTQARTHGPRLARQAFAKRPKR
jgi:hypothetical protein